MARTRTRDAHNFAFSALVHHLADTRDPATFGVNQTDVYDEDYRKADQLHSRDLLSTRLTKDNVRAKLCKLNVYGPESFFEPHVDTPRSELMFGSLVVVSPTPHEGGTLMIRKHSGDKTREWALESSALLAQVSEPSIAYVAFYSDVEHEVLPVQSGFRVTVTYNLYYVKDYADPAPAPVTQSISTFEQTFKSTLRALLDDPTFLSEGANFVFCLHHQYPLSSHRQQNE
ncbi:hypothetical protein BD413DRAFT_602834 [Trametes elegans]|nr:hypothetical protein BD413DRAFT_602834 [Trametes elegans]